MSPHIGFDENEKAITKVVAFFMSSREDLDEIDEAHADDQSKRDTTQVEGHVLELRLL